MSVRDMVDTVLCLLFILAVLAFLIWRDSTQRQQCEAKGGVYYSWRGAHLCVKPDAIIK